MTTSHNTPLESLRAEIDRLDDAILHLIEQRLAAAAAVAAQKCSDEDPRLKIRPSREKAVIARLAGRSDRASPELIGRIWRELMSYGLQAQGRMELILSVPGERALVEAMVRSRFGSAPPIRWAGDATEALRLAREEEAVAIVAHPLPALEPGLSPFDVIRDQQGSPIAYAIGRVPPEETLDAGREGDAAASEAA